MNTKTTAYVVPLPFSAVASLFALRLGRMQRINVQDVAALSLRHQVSTELNQSLHKSKFGLFMGNSLYYIQINSKIMGVFRVRVPGVWGV